MKNETGMYSVGDKFQGWLQLGKEEVVIHSFIIVESIWEVWVVDLDEARAHLLSDQREKKYTDFYAEDIEDALSQIGLHIIVPEEKQK